MWGARGPSQTPAQSLGIFYVDDQTQNRWVMKFEDPRILSEIDSVFVTVEPQGGSAQPTGMQLLTAAFLNDEDTGERFDTTVASFVQPCCRVHFA